MKYHLGCGSYYLEGYTNVDFPSSNHNVNHEVKADVYTDILKMDYEACDEIRSHHFFEHFNYIDSFVLLYKWTLSLNDGSILIIDLPDLSALCNAYLNGSVESKFRAIRYLYGSHEAPWAYHINGWSEDTLSLLLRTLGYKITSIEKYGDYKSSYPNCGVKITAELVTKFDKEDLKTSLLSLFSKYKNGDTDFENRLVDFWGSEFLKKV